MYLKSLTLKGFKSFASSTTLQLEPGITCVVGPNGSGKSNVVDALAWVMGEQGAKSLRGGKMEDVIFAGTSGRPPLGRAEVLLTIDNTDGALPIEYSEVTISRTMFRSGGSEYAINGTPCRLLDVQELLSDSGIGREMHVIVGQGQLDSILHATPEDRRGFIEEAAGVLKHRKRKEKALRKLDACDGNLTRLTDLLGEIRRQLKPLGRQAEVARRAVGVQSAVRDAKARLIADDLVTARASLEQELADESVLVARREEVEGQQAEADPERERPRGRAARGPAGAGAGAGDLVRPVRAARAAARHPVARRGAGPQRRGARHRRRRHRPRPGGARGRGRAGARAGDHHRDRGRGAPRHPRAGGLRAAHRRGRRRRGGAPGRRPAPRRRRPPRGAGPAASARSTRCARAPLPLTTRSAGSPRPTRTRSAAPTRAQRDFTALETRVAGLDAGEEGLDAEHEAAAAQLDDLEEQLAKVREEAQRAERDRASLAARKDALELGLNRKDGAGALLAASDQVSGLLGSVAALLTVRSGFETAVASALGSAADAVALENADSAIAAIGHLKEHDLGRAGLVLGSGPSVRRQRLAGAARRARRTPSTWSPAPTPSARRWPGCSTGSPWSTTWPRPGRCVARDASLTAVTRDGDLLGAHVAAGGSASQPSLIEIQAAVDEAAQQLSEAIAASERLGFDMSRLERERHEAQKRVDVALAKLHESDATLAAVAEELGQFGAQARAARGEAERLERAIGEAQEARTKDLEGLGDLETRLARAEEDPDLEDVTDEREQLAEAARACPAGRDGGPARAAHRRGAVARPARPGRPAAARRPATSARPAPARSSAGPG